MNLILLHGYPDNIGKRFAFAGSGKGPKSYTGGVTGGDAVAVPQYQTYVDSISSGGNLSVSGTYFYLAQPSSGGPRATWKLRYFTTSTAAEVANATDLSAETFVVAGFGGRY